MIKKLPNLSEDTLGELRICRFCDRVFKEGDIEITLSENGEGIVERCPFCNADLGEFNDAG